MAGDWIKMRTNLWDDPRICAVAEQLECGEAEVIGGLYWLWSAADDHTKDGKLPGITFRTINRKTGIDGFAEAIASVGWVESLDDGVLIPRFNEHNGKSAKSRALTSRRVAKHETKKRNTNDGSVSPPLGERDESNAELTEQALPREEKRREDIEEPPVSPPEGEPALDHSGNPLVFDCSGKPDSWALTVDLLREWEAAYLGLDVLGEMVKARQWNKANNRKTAKGMRRFLTNWLNRANDAPRSRGRPQQRFLSKAEMNQQANREAFERARQSAKADAIRDHVGGVQRDPGNISGYLAMDDR